MRFFRFVAIAVLLLACVVLGTACAGAKGEEGPQGANGDKGADGVGVQNIVNNGNGTFTVNLTNGTSYTTDNFTGPKGEKGDTGAQGVQGIQGLQGTPGIGVEWVGEWDSAVLYGKYDAVGYQGSSYISKQPNNTNHLPTDTNWWDLWVEKGNTGSQGVQGNPGPNMIVAMGFIWSTGNIQPGSAYNVDNCTWYDPWSCWLISFSGFSFTDAPYLVLVTPVAGGMVGYGDGGGGKLAVYTRDNAGNPYKNSFSFLVLKAP